MGTENTSRNIYVSTETEHQIIIIIIPLMILSWSSLSSSHYYYYYHYCYYSMQYLSLEGECCCPGLCHDGIPTAGTYPTILGSFLGIPKTKFLGIPRNILGIPRFISQGKFRIPYKGGPVLWQAMGEFRTFNFVPGCRPNSKHSLHPFSGPSPTSAIVEEKKWIIFAAVGAILLPAAIATILYFFCRKRHAGYKNV